MLKKEQALSILLNQRLLPLFYQESADTSKAILQALYEAGIRTVEYTNRGRHALGNFKELRRVADASMPDLQLGIGTIKNREQARQFIDAGADYIVCPTMNKEVAEETHASGRLWIPGCMTPTEIAQAEEAGASLVKIFPGNILGPSYIGAIKELFPNLSFMPTGGVEAEEENLKSWFKTGVVAVGMGSKLISKELVTQKDYEGLKESVVSALDLVKRVAIFK
jgi:2-dehydro-3-deoxyphosphogluconate aldolase/(4S)-4-hydroxy-2-oxoglutarate aldolase